MAVTIVIASLANIQWSWALQDSAFIAKPKELAACKAPVKELPPETGSR